MPAEATNGTQALARVDARLHGIRLRLGDLAVGQHLIDGLELGLLEGILRLGGRQVQDPGQLVYNHLRVVLQGGWRCGRRRRRLNGCHADDHGSHARRREHDPTIQLHT